MLPATLNLVTTVNHAPDLVRILAIGADYHLSQDEQEAAIQVVNQVLVSRVEPTILDVVQHLQAIPHLEPFAKVVRRVFLPRRCFLP